MNSAGHPGLIELIKDAFAIRNQFLSGSHDSIEAMSGRLGMNKGRLTSLVRLSYLGPEIVRALLVGSQPARADPISVATAPGAVATEAPQWHHRRRGRIPDGANRPLSRHGDSDAPIVAEVHSFLR